jgi:hypothetical protein
MRPLALLFAAAAAAALLACPWGCRRAADAPAPAPSREVATLGELEVTAQLQALPSALPDDPLYKYAYVMKYRVLASHRGPLTAGQEIFVAQYNPRKPRWQAGDGASGPIGGNVASFVAGDVHRLALLPTLDHYMGGLIDHYIDQGGPRYWALWTETGADRPASR